MGSNNSVSDEKNKVTNESILENIKKLFSSVPSQSSTSTDALTTLNIDDFGGENIQAPKGNYAEYEAQLGGKISEINKFNNINKVFSYIGGKIKDNEDSDESLEGMDDSDLEEIEDVEEDNVLEGGNLSVTSNLNMAEINGINVGKLSPTSGAPDLNGQQGGNKTVPPMDDHLTSELFGHGARQDAQHGGAKKQSDTDNLSSLNMTSDKSENINVMPVYSSTSVSDYYNDMQRENRYT